MTLIERSYSNYGSQVSRVLPSIIPELQNTMESQFELSWDTFHEATLAIVDDRSI